jgi:endonuclease YncB( thermonuclease family)
VPAQVVGVTDGDTITAIVDGRQIKVRLNGIDAPEKKQAFGNVSKQALSKLVFGKRVSLVDRGQGLAIPLSYPSLAGYYREFFAKGQ